MSTDEVDSSTSRENLAWFQNRKERWIKSPRPKLKPMPTNSNGFTTVPPPTETLSSNEKVKPLHSESTTQSKSNHVAIPIVKADHASLPSSLSSSTDQIPTLVASIPSKPTTTQIAQVSDPKKSGASGSKGIFANINLVPSSLEPTNFNVGATSLLSLGGPSGPTSFNFGTIPSTTGTTTSQSDTKESTSSTSIFGGATKATFGFSASPGISSSPYPFTTFGTNKTTTEVQMEPNHTITTTSAAGLNQSTSTSKSIFGLSHPTLGSALCQQSPFSFGTSTIAESGATSKPTTTTEDQSSSSETLNASSLDTSSNNKQDDTTTFDAKSRLIAFYQKYNPERLDSIDATLEKYKGNEEELFKKLEAKYMPPPASKYPLPSGEGPVCFLEFSIGGEIVGKVTVKLYRNHVPLACDNFQALCNGSKGKGRMGKPLCYKHSKVHRVVPLFCVQMGDFTRGDGTGGESIYEPCTSGVSDSMGRFKDETFLQHSKKGLLSMANNGPDRNGSQFFFTLRPCPSLDGKHVVFGEVLTGMEVIEQIGNLKTSSNQFPEPPVEITNCGEMVDDKEVSCQVVLENPSTPFSFGATTFGSGLGQSNPIGFGTLAASAQTSNVSGFGSSTTSTGGSSAFSFGAVASSLQLSGTDKSFGSGFSSIPSKPTSFGFSGTTAGSTTTPTFGAASTMTFATSTTKSSLGFGSPSSAFGKQEGQSSALSFGSLSLNAQSATSFPNQSLTVNNSRGFTFRAESQDGSESDDSSRDNDEDDDSDNDE